jgi:hypothetical protein
MSIVPSQSLTAPKVHSLVNHLENGGIGQPTQILSATFRSDSRKQSPNASRAWAYEYGRNGNASLCQLKAAGHLQMRTIRPDLMCRGSRVCRGRRWKEVKWYLGDDENQEIFDDVNFWGITKLGEMEWRKMKKKINLGKEFQIFREKIFM